METYSHSLKIHLLFPSLLFITLLFIFYGCKKDDSSPTSGQTPPSGQEEYPSVAKDWQGSANLKGTSFNFNLTAAFTQDKSTLTGNVIYYYTSNEIIQETISGGVSTDRYITLTGKSYTYLAGSGNWFHKKLTGRMSVSLDTISGTWTDEGGFDGTFTLVKK